MPDWSVQESLSIVSLPLENLPSRVGLNKRNAYNSFMLKKSRVLGRQESVNSHKD
jgi:hypothetical protein